MNAEANVRLNERMALVGTIDPANVTATYSDYVDMAKYQQLVAILLTGNMSAHAIDFAFYGYSDQAAGDETLIMDMTQWAAHATTSDDKQAILSMTNGDLLIKASSSGKELRYVRAKITSTSQTGYSAAVLLASVARYGLEDHDNLSSVVEVEDDVS